MLTFPLEPTDTRANPVFKNAASCAQWLRQLQLTNLQLAQQQLLSQVQELNRYPMPPPERLRTLEELRETVAHVQGSYATKLIAKPLPLNHEELLTFVAIIKLWQAMLLGYQRCLQAHLSGSHNMGGYVALACQRCIQYAGLAIFEHLRTGYAFDNKLWHELHQLYGLAEEQGWLTQDVPDPLSGKRPISCQTTYIKILLACYARPSELSRTQLQWLEDWLTEWSRHVAIIPVHSGKSDAPPLAVDLDSTQGLRPFSQVAPGGSARYLDMSPLSKLLRVNIVLLEQGRTPQQLKLGMLNNGKDCLRFHNFLHRCWCENLNTRLSDRHPVVSHAQLCCTMENIYAHLCGQPFKEPVHNTVTHALALKQSEILGRVLHSEANKAALDSTFPLEVWHVENESILGAQLTREDATGQRIGLNQLLAIRLDEQPTFSLATTAWVSVLLTGQLRIGVKYFPGIAHGMTLRPTETQPGQIKRHAPAFLLDALEAMRIPASLIIPRNWFQAGRTLDIVASDGITQRVTLGFSVERGIDYERVSFKPA
jgi:hypothetical protein